MAMAHRGFNIQDLLATLGVILNKPPFMDNRPAMSAGEETATWRIVKVRIHTEEQLDGSRTTEYYRSLRQCFRDICSLCIP
jgi:hypothetical protein